MSGAGGTSSTGCEAGNQQWLWITQWMQLEELGRLRLVSKAFNHIVENQLSASRLCLSEFKVDLLLNQRWFVPYLSRSLSTVRHLELTGAEGCQVDALAHSLLSAAPPELQTAILAIALESSRGSLTKFSAPKLSHLDVIDVKYCGLSLEVEAPALRSIAIRMKDVRSVKHPLLTEALKAYGDSYIDEASSRCIVVGWDLPHGAVVLDDHTSIDPETGAEVIAIPEVPKPKAPKLRAHKSKAQKATAQKQPPLPSVPDSAQLSTEIPDGDESVSGRYSPKPFCASSAPFIPAPTDLETPRPAGRPQTVIQDSDRVSSPSDGSDPLEGLPVDTKKLAEMSRSTDQLNHSEATNSEAASCASTDQSLANSDSGHCVRPSRLDSIDSMFDTAVAEGTNRLFRAVRSSDVCDVSVDSSAPEEEEVELLTYPRFVVLQDTHQIADRIRQLDVVLRAHTAPTSNVPRALELVVTRCRARIAPTAIHWGRWAACQKNIDDLPTFFEYLPMPYELRGEVIDCVQSWTAPSLQEAVADTTQHVPHFVAKDGVRAAQIYWANEDAMQGMFYVMNHKDTLNSRFLTTIVVDEYADWVLKADWHALISKHHIVSLFFLRGAPKLPELLAIYLQFQQCYLDLPGATIPTVGCLGLPVVPPPWTGFLYELFTGNYNRRAMAEMIKLAHPKDQGFLTRLRAERNPRFRGLLHRALVLRMKWTAAGPICQEDLTVSQRREFIKFYHRVCDEFPAGRQLHTPNNALLCIESFSCPLNSTWYQQQLRAGNFEKLRLWGFKAFPVPTPAVSVSNGIFGRAPECATAAYWAEYTLNASVHPPCQ